MQLIVDTTMTVAVVPEHLGRDRPVALVLVKAAFDLRHRQLARLAKDQPPLAGDRFVDDDPHSATAVAGDYAPIKPRGEFLVVGACHPPGGSAKISAVSVDVGGTLKQVGVFGERRWKRGLLGLAPTDPEPFASMPLTFDRAFGDPKLAVNPFGRGADASGPLPNLEDVRRPIASIEDRPTPTALGPLAPTHPARMRHAGTYDARWRSERYPHWPADLDIRYFHAAPEDQRSHGFWSGKEEIALKNLHPDQPYVRSVLPGLMPRAYVQREDGGALDRVSLVLDTIVLDGELMQAHLTWRGAAPLASMTFEDVHRVFVFDEPTETPTSPASANERMNAALLLARLEAAGFRPRKPQESATAATVILKRHAKRSGLESPTLAGAASFAELTLMGGTIVGPPSEDVPLSEDGASAEMETPEEAPATAAVDDAASAPVGPKTLGELLGVGPAELASTFAALGIEVPAGVNEALTHPAPEAMTLERLEAQMDAHLATLDLPRGAGDPEAARASALRGLGLDATADAAALLGALDQRAGAIDNLPPLPDPDELEKGLKGAGASAQVIADLRGLLATAAAGRAQAEAPRVASDTAVPPVEPEAEPEAAEPPPSPRERVLADQASATPVVGDLSGIDLAGADLPAWQASGALLARSNLAGATLHGADLSRAMLAGADLSGADLSGANLERADLSGANLSGANLSGANVRSASLDAATLDGAMLASADLTGASLRNASLREAQAPGVTLSNADLSGASLAGLRADGSVLRDTCMHGADASGAVLTRSDLSGLRAKRGASFDGADLRHASAARARFCGSSLRGVKLGFSDLERADFSTADLSGAGLVGCGLRGARLDGARLDGALATQSDLLGASLRGASLLETDLRGSSLHGAELLDAQVAGARFEGADLSSTKLERA